MKKLVLCIMSFVSLNSFAADTGNICTIALFKKSSDFYGNPIPGKALGVESAINTDGTAGVFAKLYDVSKKRAIIFRGVIDMGGAFKAQFEEVDQDKDGWITFKNSKILSEEKYYYSPYPELPAKNEPALVVMDDYIATVSCIIYGKL